MARLPCPHPGGTVQRVPACPNMFLGFSPAAPRCSRIHHLPCTSDTLAVAPSLPVPPVLPSTLLPPGRAGWELPAAKPAQGSAEPARPVPPPRRSVSGQAAERGAEPRGDALGGGGAVGEFWQPVVAPAPLSAVPVPAELSTSDESSLSDAILLEEGKRTAGTQQGKCPPSVPSVPTLCLSRRGDAVTGTFHPQGPY